MNRRTTKTIKLALQGGGSHGAFTWGVLDQLLQDERLHIEAVSGTSAGAMNAVALADGMASGGPAEARKESRKILVRYQRRGAIQPDPALALIDMFMGNWSLDNSPGYILMDHLSRVFRPTIPIRSNFNPLRDVVAGGDRLRRGQ